MKIIDVPQSGKQGLNVSYRGRNGLVRRQWIVPANPRTSAQLAARQHFASQAATWRSLTDAQQDAWISAAASEQTRSVLGQSGNLTGSQLFTKINCALLAIGEAPVSTPPAKPLMTSLPISGLEITNTAGVVALKLLTTDAPPEGTMLWACRPQSAGTRRAAGMKLLGTLNTPVANKIDITAPYTAAFGAPSADHRIFVRCNENNGGWEGPAVSFQGRVPTAS